MKKPITIATTLAKKAGKIMLKNFSLGMKKEWKNNTSPVTVTDITIEKLVKKTLAKEFPQHGFIGEEGGKTEQREFMWICDPVDGTIPFSHGCPTFVFMLALTQNGRPILGVIYDPVLKRLFSAEKGKGAFLNGKRIHVSKKSTLELAVFNSMWWNNALFDTSKVYIELTKRKALHCEMNSIGYDDMLVACGEFSIVVFPGKYHWDSAAPDIIVTEAGGTFTDLFGNIIDYRKDLISGHVATNGILHQEVLNIVKSVMK